MPLHIPYSVGNEELLFKHTTAVEIAKSLRFRALTGIKVLTVVFIPILALNYIAKFIPSFFSDNGSFGVLDVIFWIFIAWDTFKTYQNIANYYPNLIISEIEKRVCD